MRREDDAVVLEGAVTLDTVALLAGPVEEHLRRGARVVDFRDVTEVDSSAIALALEWRRIAAESNSALRLAHLPAAMQNLAELYGVSELLQSVA